MNLAALTIAALFLVFAIDASSVPSTPDSMVAETSQVSVLVETETQDSAESSSTFGGGSAQGSSYRSYGSFTMSSSTMEEELTQSSSSNTAQQKEAKTPENKATVKVQAEKLYTHFAKVLPKCAKLFEKEKTPSATSVGISQSRPQEQESDYKLFQWVDLNVNLRRAMINLQGLLLQMEQAEANAELRKRAKLHDKHDKDSRNSICEWFFENDSTTMIPCGLSGKPAATNCDNQSKDSFGICSLDRQCQFGLDENYGFFDTNPKLNSIKALMNPEIVHLLEHTNAAALKDPAHCGAIYGRSIRLISAEIFKLEKFLQREEALEYRGFDCKILHEGTHMGFVCQHNAGKTTTICKMVQTTVKKEPCFMNFDETAIEKIGFTGSFRFGSFMANPSSAVAAHPIGKQVTCKKVNKNGQEQATCDVLKESLCMEAKGCSGKDLLYF